MFSLTLKFKGKTRSGQASVLSFSHNFIEDTMAGGTLQSLWKLILLCEQFSRCSSAHSFFLNYKKSLAIILLQNILEHICKGEQAKERQPPAITEIICQINTYRCIFLIGVTFLLFQLHILKPNSTEI